MPALALVAEPCSSLGIEHPEHALFISKQELGHFDSEVVWVQVAAIALGLQFAKAAFGLIKIHRAFPISFGLPGSRGTAGPAIVRPVLKLVCSSPGC